MISLEQAKELVQLVENGLQDEATALVAQMNLAQHSEDLQEVVKRDPMLQEIGTLTRELHDSLKHFHIDDRMTEIANDEIPDARDRLNYVIEKRKSLRTKPWTQLIVVCLSLIVCTRVCCRFAHSGIN